MDLSGFSSMMGGSRAIPASGNYYFGNVQVRPAVSTGAGLPSGAPVQGGGVASGVYAPAGATPASLGYNTMPSGASDTPSTGTASAIGAGLADSFKSIGQMISQYGNASAAGRQVAVAQAPNTPIQPQLATFTIPTIGR